jgi:hypothetical protein
LKRWIVNNVDRRLRRVGGAVMGWLLTVLILGFPGDLTPRDIETHRFPDAQTCFQAEISAKAWGRANNITVVTGCHPMTEG